MRLNQLRWCVLPNFFIFVNEDYTERGGAVPEHNTQLIIAWFNSSQRSRGIV